MTPHGRCQVNYAAYVKAILPFWGGSPLPLADNKLTHLVQLTRAYGRIAVAIREASA